LKFERGTTMIILTDTRKAAEYFERKLEFTTGPVELHSMIESGEYVDIIDVRSKEDFYKGHIPGAINLPKERWSTFHGLSRDRTNIVYCYSQQCHLAAKACKYFAENGYPVMELEGGFDAWEKHSLPINR
jgi:rhodanese-related sulfurtransferase